MVDWKKIKETVEVRSVAKTGAVKKYDQALKEIMADGETYTVSELRGYLEAGYNEGLGPDDAKVHVNWITVQYTLDHKPGFKMVSKNKYKYVAPTKKVEQKK